MDWTEAIGLVLSLPVGLLIVVGMFVFFYICFLNEW